MNNNEPIGNTEAANECDLIIPDSPRGMVILVDSD